MATKKQKDKLSVVEIKIGPDALIRCPDEDGDFFMKTYRYGSYFNIDEAKKLIQYLQYHIKQSK